MTGYGSLFERLCGEAGPRSSVSGEAAVKASIAAHLMKMLGTRAGSVPTATDYGLPDFNDMYLSRHDALVKARSAVSHFIDKYEPRLTKVRVVPISGSGDTSELCFRIEGVMEVKGLWQGASFTASLYRGGNVLVG